MAYKNPLIARPESVPGQQFINTPEYPQIKVNRFRGGLNVDDDPADLQDDELVQAQNIYIRNDRITRISGRTNIEPTKPDSNPVRALVSLQSYNGNLTQYRLTDNKMYRRTELTWEEVTPVAPTPFYEYPNNVISVDDRHFFSSNGSVAIKEVDIVNDTYDDLGNALRYRYITAFGDRLVGFNIRDENPVTVGWSGNLNYDEWNPLVDPSAGSIPLVESQSDYADFGTGIFGFADKLLLLKQRSIWLANKTGSSTNPFYFYVSSPSFGCDTPTSVQKIPNGIVYYDRRTNNVYVFDVNNPTPVPIGTKVRDIIFETIESPDYVSSSFNSIELEYKLIIRDVATGLTTIFIYNFKNNSWWTEYTSNVSCISSLNFSIPTVLIQDLPGNIEDLVGTIAGLGSEGYPTPTDFYGLGDGDIQILDDSVVTGYDTILQSKTWTAPDNNDFFVNRMTFTYEIITAGTFTIAYSKDNGLTYTDYKTVTMLAGDIGKRIIVNCVKAVKSRQFNWRISCSSGRLSIVDFKAQTAPSGLSTR